MSAAQKKRRIEVGDWVRVIAIGKDSQWTPGSVKLVNGAGPQQVVDIVYRDPERFKGLVSYVELSPGYGIVNPICMGHVRLQRVPAPTGVEQTREASDD